MEKQLRVLVGTAKQAQDSLVMKRAFELAETFDPERDITSDAARLEVSFRRLTEWQVQQHLAETALELDPNARFGFDAQGRLVTAITHAMTGEYFFRFWLYHGKAHRERVVPLESAIRALGLPF